MGGGRCRGVGRAGELGSLRGRTDRRRTVVHRDDESLVRGITPPPIEAPNEGTQRAEVPVSTSNPAAAFMLACVAIVLLGYVRAMFRR
jgi:hypothetical protein